MRDSWLGMKLASLSGRDEHTIGDYDYLSSVKWYYSACEMYVRECSHIPIKRSETDKISITINP